MNNSIISRRHFLKGQGALVVGFSLGPWMGDALAENAPGVNPSKSLSTTDVEGFISLNADGTVSIYSGKVDLGTGIKTAISQIAAEELDVPFSKVILIQGDTLTTPDQGPTYGSLSIQIGGMQIRQACATAREALINAAANKLGVGISEITTQNSTCVAGEKSIRYVDLVSNEVLNIKVNPKAKLKDPRTYTVVGKDIPRLDIPGKLTGEFTYMQDFKLPGMLHARVIRPKGIGSKLISYDDALAKKIPGFVQVVHDDNFLAVVATNEWDAIRASKAINVTWSNWAGLPDQDQLWAYLRASKVASTESLQKVGDVGSAPQGAKTLTATYDFAIHTHGSIGPSCAVAQWENDKVTCWSASQQTHLLRKQLAQMLSMSEEHIRCVYIDGAGCYGRNGHEDAGADAVLISKIVGKPVRVQWMRADEHGWDPKGPPSLYDYRATLDAEGKVVSWEADAYIAARPKQISVTLLAADLAVLPMDPPHPGNIQNSLAIQYKFPNIQANAHYVENTPLRPGWLRTPGRLQNTFANESFIDELAYLAKSDPFMFRIQHLNDPRGIECLERVMHIAKWEKKFSNQSTNNKGDIYYGRGVSYIKYELVRTYIAVVADVQVNRKTGKVLVNKFYVAHDCGQIINPDGLRNQIDGNLIQTVSRSLIEEVKFDRSAVTSLDWNSYPILKFPEVPAIEISLIDRPNEKPWGAGEPAASVVPSAIANGIFDAIGIRVRSVPFTPGKVLAAIKNKVV
jgi:CO/xanthine dehydrogenase Mo-binding subunit